jgi:hypothetical protein
MALIGLELQASREFSAPVTLAGTFVLMQRRCTVWLGVHNQLGCLQLRTPIRSPIKELPASLEWPVGQRRLSDFVFLVRISRDTLAKTSYICSQVALSCISYFFISTLLDAMIR